MLEVGLEPTRLSTKDFESFVAAFTPFEQLSRYKNPSTYTSRIVLCLLNTRSWRYQTEYPSFSLINGFGRTCTCSSRYHTGYFSYREFQRSASGVINEILNNLRLKLQSQGNGQDSNLRPVRTNQSTALSN